MSDEHDDLLGVKIDDFEGDEFEDLHKHKDVDAPIMDEDDIDPFLTGIIPDNDNDY